MSWFVLNLAEQSGLNRVKITGPSTPPWGTSVCHLMESYSQHKQCVVLQTGSPTPLFFILLWRWQRNLTFPLINMLNSRNDFTHLSPEHQIWRTISRILCFTWKKGRPWSLGRWVSHQWAGPGVREGAQFVPAHVQRAEGLQTVHEWWGKTAQGVIRHIQLLQLPETDPVHIWHNRIQRDELISEPNPNFRWLMGLAACFNWFQCKYLSFVVFWHQSSNTVLSTL